MYNDDRVVLTFDAGGTNFVFSAMQGGREILEPITIPSHADHLERCLETIKKGFDHMLSMLEQPAVAISFAFPGPTDYPNGVIGDLKNLPGFRGGVPLGKILENQYQLPAFINNDGDLYTYGEALGGFLPEVNQLMAAAGNPKRFKNLVGLTLGTGFGGGFVSDGTLITGDNSIASEVWILSNRITPSRNAEEEVSIRAVLRNYRSASGTANEITLTPKEIYDIASGSKEGDREAAVHAFESMGRHLGDVIANLISLMDGLVVMGGGISGADRFFMPAVMNELRNQFDFRKHDPIPRLIQQVFDLNDPSGQKGLSEVTGKYIDLPGTDQHVYYDEQPKVGIGTSRIGASRAISLGAYAFALSKLDEFPER
ncbi:MAG: ROK family protein [Bacteroidales bacterium]|nr:ROK family protein [Bacteroidales bacterium]